MVRPGMSDGRCFTSYEQNCQKNAVTMIKHQIPDNNSYRKFLQENAAALMQKEMLYAKTKSHELESKQNNKLN